MDSRDSMQGFASLLRAAGPKQGQEVKLNKERFVIGRSQIGNDLVLNDDEISRCHAHLVRGRDGTWTVEDHSANGTFVDGQRVSRTSLRPGCLLAFGSNKEMSFIFTAPGIKEGKPPQSQQSVVVHDNAPAATNCRLQLVLNRYAVRDIPLRIGSLYLGNRRAPDTFQVDDRSVAPAHALIVVRRRKRNDPGPSISGWDARQRCTDCQQTTGGRRSNSTGRLRHPTLSFSRRREAAAGTG